MPAPKHCQDAWEWLERPSAENVSSSDHNYEGAEAENSAVLYSSRDEITPHGRVTVVNESHMIDIHFLKM